MSPETLLSLTGMALAASWTPGPNNSMLASSGATFGVKATIPHALGVALGFPVMIFLVGLGLGEIFRQSAILREVMRYLGAALLLWIAYRIATADPPGTPGSRSRPLRILEAAIFQWVNPKGWMAAIAISSQFVQPGAMIQTSSIIAVIFLATGLSSSLSWAFFGQAVGRWLRSPLRLRVFNVTMSLLLVGFLIVVLTEG